MTLMFKIFLAVIFGAIIGYLFRVFSKRRLGVAFDIASPQQIQISGTSVNFVQAGQGPDLLLIHGIGASIFCWRLVFRGLSRKFRVTAIDLPGFGASEKNPNLKYDLDSQVDRVAEFIQKLGLAPVNILGCSMGGAIALWLGVRHAHLINKIVTISPAAHHDIVWFNTRPLTKLVGVIGHRISTPYFIEKLYRRVVSRQELVTFLNINEYFRPYSTDRNAPICFWKAHDTLRDPRLPDQLKQLDNECLILYGEKDKLVRRKFTNEISRVLRRGKLVLHPTGGHHLMEDEPDFVIASVSEFLLST